MFFSIVTSICTIRKQSLLPSLCVILLAGALLSLSGCAVDDGSLGSGSVVAITHDDFALADANHDEKLSRTEADHYLAFVVFTSSDSDADGRLTAQEWIHDNQSEAEAFRLCDANGDGVVTLSEAIAYSQRDRAVIALMRQADRNRDGKLNRAEIDAYFIRVAGLGR